MIDAHITYLSNPQVFIYSFLGLEPSPHVGGYFFNTDVFLWILASRTKLHFMLLKKHIFENFQDEALQNLSSVFMCTMTAQVFGFLCHKLYQFLEEEIVWTSGTAFEVAE